MAQGKVEVLLMNNLKHPKTEPDRFCRGRTTAIYYWAWLAVNCPRTPFVLSLLHGKGFYMEEHLSCKSRTWTFDSWKNHTLRYLQLTATTFCYLFLKGFKKKINSYESMTLNESWLIWLNFLRCSGEKKLIMKKFTSILLFIFCY